MNEREAHDNLLAYMMGFRKGCSGGAFMDEQMRHPAFRLGHMDGRKAVRRAYHRATKFYGAELSPLRTQ